MMHTVLPREEAVEAIFSKIVASPASCEQLREVVYEHLEDEQIFEKNQAEHFTEFYFRHTRMEISVHCCWNCVEEVCLIC